MSLCHWTVKDLCQQSVLHILSYSYISNVPHMSFFSTQYCLIIQHLSLSGLYGWATAAMSELHDPCSPWWTDKTLQHVSLTPRLGVLTFVSAFTTLLLGISLLPRTLSGPATDLPRAFHKLALVSISGGCICKWMDGYFNSLDFFFFFTHRFAS